MVADMDESFLITDSWGKIQKANRVTSRDSFRRAATLPERDGTTPVPFRIGAASVPAAFAGESVNV